jgi:hypothetical protein
MLVFRTRDALFAFKGVKVPLLTLFSILSTLGFVDAGAL